MKNAIITLTGFGTYQDYQDDLRFIQYYDKEHDRVLEFITNNFNCALHFNRTVVNNLINYI